MIQTQSIVDVADNSGARRVMCIRVRRLSGIGMRLMMRLLIIRI